MSEKPQFTQILDSVPPQEIAGYLSVHLADMDPAVLTGLGAAIAQEMGRRAKSTQKERTGTDNLAEMLSRKAAAVTRLGKFEPGYGGFTQDVKTLRPDRINPELTRGQGTVYPEAYYTEGSEDMVAKLTGYRNNNYKKGIPLAIVGSREIVISGERHQFLSITFISLQEELNPTEGDRAGLLPIWFTILLPAEEEVEIVRRLKEERPGSEMFVGLYNSHFKPEHGCGKYKNGEGGLRYVFLDNQSEGQKLVNKGGEVVDSME